LNFPDKLPAENPVTVTLDNSEWLAIILKLAGRDHDQEYAMRGEAKMLRQILDAKG
jgi:hypothetical protein